MKKLLVLLLTLMLLLCSCDKLGQAIGEYILEHAETGTNYIPIDEPEISTTAEITTTVEETTVAETLPPEPEVEIPYVVSAEKYEKDIVDIMGYDGFDYPHSVEYPKIDSDKAGAAALNAKIAERYTKIINQLKNGEEANNIYNIGYQTSVCDNVIFIHVIESTGWQYSEGMTEQKIFYYDAVNDKELTAEEYAAHFGIDLEKAKENIVYTYELARSYMDDTSVIISGDDENALYEPAPGKLFPAKQSEFYYDFDGLEVTENYVNLYYNGQQYVLSIYEFALDRETLLPRRPHYMGYVLPNNSEINEVKITLDNGTVTEYSIPEDTGVYNVKISSMVISVFSSVRLEDWEISINGGKKYTAGGQMYNGENQYQYDFYIGEYIPIEELKTIEFTK